MPEDIAQAVRILRAGGLVAFPTETVYGLGADATNATAVQRIFAAKGRPATNPLIVHVADIEIARRYTTRWDQPAQSLADAFWPGPLAIIVPKAAAIVAAVSAGRETVALRCPDHPMALALLREFAGPLAAPSANRSTRVSPTTAEHVREELGNTVDLILDGGACRVGIESTVLDLTGATPVILRPGAITLAQIQAVIGRTELVSGSVSPTEAAASPGQHAIHYAPRAAAFRFTREETDDVVRWCKAHLPKCCGILLLESCDTLPAGLRDLPFKFRAGMADGSGPDAYARNLYAALRSLDSHGVDVIFVEMPPDTPAWTAVRDRLMRAARSL